MTLNRIIVRPGGVGDSLLLAPALTVLRREFPGLRTALAGYPERLAPLLQANLADALIPLEVWLNHPEGLPDRDTSGENSCLCSSVPPRIDSFFPQKPAWLAGTASEALFHLHPILPEGGNSTHVAEHLAHCLGLSPPIRCTSPLESLLPFDRERQESHRIWIHPGAGEKTSAGHWISFCKSPEKQFRIISLWSFWLVRRKKIFFPDCRDRDWRS